MSSLSNSLFRVFSITTPWTGGPVWIPGDNGEPWQWDETVNVLISGMPQVVNNYIGPGSGLGQWTANNIGKPIDDFFASQRGQSRAVSAAHSGFAVNPPQAYPPVRERN